MSKPRANAEAGHPYRLYNDQMRKRTRKLKQIVSHTTLPHNGPPNVSKDRHGHRCWDHWSCFQYRHQCHFLVLASADALVQVGPAMRAASMLTVRAVDGCGGPGHLQLQQVMVGRMDHIGAGSHPYWSCASRPSHTRPTLQQESNDRRHTSKERAQYAAVRNQRGS